MQFAQINSSKISVFGSNYGTFGMQLPNRHESVGDSYRYGFQNQEVDTEVKGEGNSVNYEYRMHDPRIGRFFAVDPLFRKYPFWSPYQFSGNQVIHTVEIEGLEAEENLNPNEQIASEQQLPEVRVSPYHEVQGKEGDMLGGRINYALGLGFAYDYKLQVSNFADATDGIITDARGWRGKGLVVYIPRDTELGQEVISQLEVNHGIKFDNLSKREKRRLLRVEWDKSSFWSGSPDRSDLFHYKTLLIKYASGITIPVSLPTTVPVAISPGSGQTAGGGELYVNIDVLGKNMADNFAKAKKGKTSQRQKDVQHGGSAEDSSRKGKNWDDHSNRRPGDKGTKNRGKKSWTDRSNKRN